MRKVSTTAVPIKRDGIECAGLLRCINGDIRDEDINRSSFEQATMGQIHVILLLINQDENPQFELFHLEFATESATVGDLLGQIPLYASNEALRKQAYQGVCDYSGRQLGVCSRLTNLKPNPEEEGAELSSRRKQPLAVGENSCSSETYLAIAVPADLSFDDTIARSRVILRHPVVLHEIELCGLDHLTLSGISSVPIYQFVMVLLCSRSFELVHADVFNIDAKVSDILALIPRSATQEEIRKQLYTGLYDSSTLYCPSSGERNRKETKNRRIHANTFIRSIVGRERSGVLVPMPANLHEKECARRARTILARPEIVEMLRSTGIELPENVSIDNFDSSSGLASPVESSDEESTISVWLPRLCMG